MQKTTTYSVPFGMYYMPIMLANTVCIFLNITPACVLFFGKAHYLSEERGVTLLLILPNPNTSKLS